MSIVYGRVEHEKWEEILEPLFIALSMLINFMIMLTYWLKVSLPEIFYEIAIRLRALVPLLYEYLAPYEPIVMWSFFTYVFIENGIAMLLYYKSRYSSYEKAFSALVTTPLIIAEIMLALLASLFLPATFIYAVFGFIGIFFNMMVDKVYVEIVGSPRYRLGRMLEEAEKVAQKKRKKTREEKRAEEIAKRAFWGIESD